MSSYRINNKNYPWPDDGETNWGGTVTDFVFALTNAVNELFSKVVLNSRDQTISGEKTFATIPKVSILSQESPYPRLYNLVYSEQATNLDVLTGDIGNKLNQILLLIGQEEDGQILSDIVAEPLLKTIGTSKHNLKNYLRGLMEYVNRLTPIGTIKSTYFELEAKHIAHWVSESEESEETIFLTQEKLDQFYRNSDFNTIIHRNNVGFYKSGGGNWALCDGKMPLPLIFGNAGLGREGSIQYHHVLNVPNLMDDVFLRGGKERNTPSVTGSNDLTLTTDNLPAHSHDIAHSGTTDLDGGHYHVYGKREVNITNYKSVESGSGHAIGHITSTQSMVNTEDVDDHTHPFSLDFPSQQTGGNDVIDKKPKNFPVRYYMRIR